MAYSNYLKRFEKNSFFKFYLELTRPGIYALVNEKDKRVYIQATQDCIGSISRVSKDLSLRHHTNKQLVKDQRKLNIRILELTDEDLEHQRLRLLKWSAQFKEQGYTIYNEKHIPMYKPRIKVTAEYKACVVLETRGRRTVEVSQFDNIAKAEEYILNTPLFDMVKKAYNL